MSFGDLLIVFDRLAGTVFILLLALLPPLIMGPGHPTRLTRPSRGAGSIPKNLRLLGRDPASQLTRCTGEAPPEVAPRVRKGAA